MLAMREPMVRISHRYWLGPSLVSFLSLGKRLMVPSRSISKGSTCLYGTGTTALRSISILTFMPAPRRNICDGARVAAAARPGIAPLDAGALSLRSIGRRFPAAMQQKGASAAAGPERQQHRHAPAARAIGIAQLLAQP